MDGLGFEEKREILAELINDEFIRYFLLDNEELLGRVLFRLG